MSVVFSWLRQLPFLLRLCVFRRVEGVVTFVSKCERGVVFGIGGWLYSVRVVVDDSFNVEELLGKRVCLSLKKFIWNYYWIPAEKGVMGYPGCKPRNFITLEVMSVE